MGPDLKINLYSAKLAYFIKSFVVEKPQVILEFGEFMATTAYLVKNLGIMSIAKFGAILGLIYGIIMGLVMATVSGAMMGSIGGAIAAAIGTLIITAIAGLVGGFITGAVVSFIYNFVLGSMGGIEVDLEVKQ